MGEISRPGVTLDGTLAHLHALFQLARNGPPHWARHDLTFGQLRLLFVLAHAGPVSIGKLADMLSVTDATASEIVDRLERRSLAIRSHRSDDRRVVECRLSDAGARLVAEVAGARAEMMRASLSVLTATELAQLDGLLRVMAERLPAVIAPSASAEGDAQVMSETPLATAPEDSRGKA